MYIYRSGKWNPDEVSYGEIYRDQLKNGPEVARPSVFVFSIIKH